MKDPSPPSIIVSSCLAGLCTRYDGTTKSYPACLHELEKYNWIPVCPEQLGGLPTPREAAVLYGGDGHDVLSGKARVITNRGVDVTKNFIRGAQQVAKLIRCRQITTAILKARSPSCAVSGIPGVTAALLAQEGIKLLEF